MFYLLLLLLGDSSWKYLPRMDYSLFPYYFASVNPLTLTSVIIPAPYLPQEFQPTITPFYNLSEKPSK